MSPRNRRRDERGAIAAATAVVMGCLLVIASLVIDLGRDRVVARDMQAMADVIALDVVRQLDGRPADSYGTLLNDAKDVSLANQAGDLISIDTDDVAVEAVIANRDTGDWRLPAAGEVPNAVWAHATGHSGIRFLPSTTPKTNIKRSALAMVGPPIACISAGATFAEVQQQGWVDTLLGSLLQNQGVDRLTVLDPYGLAALDMEIPLVDLAAKMNVGSVEQILTADISAHDFVLAISDVLPPKNDNSASPKALLDAIVNGLPDTAGFKPGDILDLDTGGGSGTTLVINTFTLVQAVIMVSNQDHFVEVKDSPPISIPGLAKIKVYASVVEPPRIACGPVGAVAKSAQIRVKIEAEVTAVSGNVASASVLPLEVEVASGSARVTDVRCTAGSPSVSVEASTAVGTAKLKLIAKIIGLPVTVTAPKTGTGNIGSGTPSTLTTTFSFPEDDLPAGQTLGGVEDINLSSLTPIDINVIGLDLLGLVNPAVSSLLVLVDPLVSTLLADVLENLGLSVGTVRVQPTARPSCNEAFLIEKPHTS